MNVNFRAQLMQFIYFIYVIALITRPMQNNLDLVDSKFLFKHPAVVPSPHTYCPEGTVKERTFFLTSSGRGARTGVPFA